MTRLTAVDLQLVDSIFKEIPQLDDARRRALSEAVEVVARSSPDFRSSPEMTHITWFGQYGCALLAVQTSVGRVQLQLVCLDEWEFQIHSGIGSAVRTHCSHAGSDASKLLKVGFVEEAEYQEFLARGQTLLAAAQTRTGDKRSAASNEQGNQKTPAMIQAVLKDALNGKRPADGSVLTPPRGGFTDVGLHTGGHPRHTSWPLMRAVLQVLIESKSNHLVYRIAMAELLLRIVEERIVAVESSDAAETGHDSIMQMLQAAVREGEALADDKYDEGHDMKLFEARCVDARHRLDQVVQRRADSAALSFALPSMRIEDLVCHPPCLTLPAEATPKLNGSATLSDIREAASTNIGWLPEPLVSGTWQELLAWLAWLADPRLQNNETVTLLHVLSTVERFVFGLSLEQSLDPDIVVMEKVVDSYRQSAATLRSSSAAAALMSVELVSRELLVVWVAFCISHSVTKKDEPLLNEYAVALRWQDLQHLVLSEKLAVDAALSVAEYLKANGLPNKLPVFSLRANDATIDLATRHSNASTLTQTVWRTEEEAAKNRKTQHWNEVLLKHQSLKTLDAELAVLENKLRMKNREFQDLEKPRGGLYRTSASNDREYREVQTTIFDLELQISWKKASIKSAEQPPSTILQPLPQQEQNAMPILFFLRMPDNFQVLSRLSFTAQQMLLPPSAVVQSPRSRNEIKLDKEIECKPPPVDWRTYYLSTSTACSHSAICPKVILGTTGKVVSGEWYQKNVRSYHSMSDGIWHPDSMGTALFWSGGSCALDNRRGIYFNPFRDVEPCVTVQRFTEQLPHSDQNMQYAMEQYGSSASEPSRGNVPEAEQDTKLDWLASKQHHLAFGALRAYPNQQLRKLCVALREKSLPLNEPGVHLLLRQTLFQMGELSDETQPIPRCRTDMEMFGGWAALRSELLASAEELRCKCREHPSILILGELAAVVSQWDPQTRDVSRDFVTDGTETLDGTETGVRTWGSHLPVRLREMHSHWLCREKDMVLLRGKLFHERHISFFLGSDSPNSVLKNCYRVKEHQAHQPFKALFEIRDSFDLLNVVAHAPADSECMALKVLTKFETDARFVHTLYAKKGEIRNLVFELPRYAISFSLAEDGKLWSENFQDCFLSEQQILPDTLHGFQQYLLLESIKSGSTLVLVPAGEIRKSSAFQSRSGDGARVFVHGSNLCDAARKTIVFHIHPRFGSLDVAAGPHAVEARLQLAALYAATDSEVPERRSRQTGGEVAMELLRQSWVNRPLTSTEYTHLRSISSFDQFTPALSMLCSELGESARELSFLYTDETQRRTRGPLSSLACEDACTEYAQRKQSGRLSPRAFLSDEEETRVLCLKIVERPRGRRLPAGTLGPRASPAAIRDKCASLFSDVERELMSMVVEEDAEPSPFPFDVSSFEATEIARTMIEELEKSWDADLSKKTMRLVVEVDAAAVAVSALLTLTSELRLELENAVLHDVDQVPASAGWHAAAFNMRRSANLAPRITTRDLARASWQAETELRRFNPFLSATAVQELRADILMWLQACVLEDKLTRMRALASARDAQELVRELREVGPRQWSVEQHPQWLVFEVEQRLPIRRVQYKVAQFLIESPAR